MEGFFRGAILFAFGAHLPCELIQRQAHSPKLSRNHICPYWCSKWEVATFSFLPNAGKPVPSQLSVITSEATHWCTQAVHTESRCIEYSLLYLLLSHYWTGCHWWLGRISAVVEIRGRSNERVRSSSSQKRFIKFSATVECQIRRISSLLPYLW